MAQHWMGPQLWRGLNLRQRRQMLCTAASLAPHHHGALRGVLAACGCTVTPPVMAAAAAVGNWDACKLLAAQYGCPRDAGVCRAAAASGSYAGLQWASRGEQEEEAEEGWADPHDSVSTSSEPLALMLAACRGGRLELMAELEETRAYDPACEDMDDNINDQLRLLHAAVDYYCISESRAATAPRGCSSSTGRRGGSGSRSGSSSLGRRGQGQQGAAATGEEVLEAVMDRLGGEPAAMGLIHLVSRCPLPVLQRFYDRVLGLGGHDDDVGAGRDGGGAGGGEGAAGGAMLGGGEYGGGSDSEDDEPASEDSWEGRHMHARMKKSCCCGSSRARQTTGRPRRSGCCARSWERDGAGTPSRMRQAAGARRRSGRTS